MSDKEGEELGESPRDTQVQERGVFILHITLLITVHLALLITKFLTLWLAVLITLFLCFYS